MSTVEEAARAVPRIDEIDRAAGRRRVQQCLSIDTLVQCYERVCARSFEIEAQRRS